MWKSFTINNKNYILKTYLDDKYKCLLTDLDDFWIEELSRDEIFYRCQNLNPSVETDEHTFMHETMTILTDPNCDVTYNIDQLENCLILTLKYKVDEIFFKFNLNLTKSNDLSLFCKEFTKPLINTVLFLEDRNKFLVDAVVKKDAEIKSHVFENGPITKKQLITEPLNKEDAEFNPTHLCCKLLSNFVEPETTKTEVKTEEPKEKAQPVKRKSLSLAQKIMFKKKKPDDSETNK